MVAYFEGGDGITMTWDQDFSSVLPEIRSKLKKNM